MPNIEEGSPPRQKMGPRLNVSQHPSTLVKMPRSLQHSTAPLLLAEQSDWISPGQRATMPITNV